MEKKRNELRMERDQINAENVKIQERAQSLQTKLQQNVKRLLEIGAQLDLIGELMKESSDGGELQDSPGNPDGDGQGS